MMLTNLKSFGPIAWMLGNWQLALAALGALAIYGGVMYMVGRDHGKDSAQADLAQASTKAADKAMESGNRAVAEAEADTATISGNKEKADAAIEATNSGAVAPSRASNALMCERLRRTGKNIDRIPACQ